MNPWQMVDQTATIGSWLPLQLFTGNFLSLAILFFVLALVAAIVGLRGVAGISMEIARIFIFIFLVLLVVSLLL